MANKNIKGDFDDMQFDEEFDYQKLSYAFAVYDDENNIYEIFTRMHMGETEKYDYNSIFMQRELGIKQNKNIIEKYIFLCLEGLGQCILLLFLLLDV